ncbi:MAG: hypothetical protein NTW21_33185 [Verrucomicrobia bacterium]|nr:hypothetical protein [Verrucomicrobiota bacterium]
MIWWILGVVGYWMPTPWNYSEFLKNNQRVAKTAICGFIRGKQEEYFTICFQAG